VSFRPQPEPTPLKDVREKMADLARMEAVLSELVCACHARKGTFPAR
jgi:MerR family mercuric resistance operon transcriptional regulator